MLNGTVARRRLLTAVLVSVLVTAGALAVSTRLRSPAQVAAEAAPPPPSVLTEPVRRRVLTATVVLRGRVSADQSVDVVARGGADGLPVVTAVRVGYGATVQPAQVLMEISGRPVFALPGAVPAYRDLRPGASGRDVAQLQRALDTLGFGSGDSDGVYGPGTETAVRDFYRSKGYDPLPAGPDDEERLRQAETALTAAERALRDARLAHRTAPAAVRASAGLAVRDREEDLRAAEEERDRVAERTGPMVPADETVFLSGFPARVDAVSATVGATATEKLLTVSAGKLVVTGRLTAYQKDLIRPGMPVEILAEVSGATAEATVKAVADTPAQPGTATGEAGAPADTAQPGYDMVVTPTGGLDADLAGQDVRLTVTAASSGTEVLVVPLAAVSAGADGKTSVTVVDGASRSRVEVTPGLVGDGFVQVTPVGGARLEPEQKVLVGS